MKMELIGEREREKREESNMRRERRGREESEFCLQTFHIYISENVQAFKARCTPHLNCDNSLTVQDIAKLKTPE